MKYKAVIFDLFGTLVPSFTEREYRVILSRMADILGMPPHDFRVLWSETFSQSILGVIPGVEAKISQIGRQRGAEFARDKIEGAAALMSGYSALCMQPRPEALEVLSQIKRKGLKIGLISDCTSDTPELWKKTALAPLIDVTVFSCLVGLRKPDPRIYGLAIRQLAVNPAECLYVGDGASHELTGALEAGLQAAQLYIPAEKGSYRVDVETWNGKVIASLWEVLGIVEEL
jgi:putative hydrolase of the HAD superfamily